LLAIDGAAGKINSTNQNIQVMFSLGDALSAANHSWKMSTS